jgi:hypothetical protein
LLLLTAAIAMLVAVYSTWVRSIDGISGNLLAIVFTEDTEYATGYSNAGFRAVQPGMPRRKVYELLGEPFAKWTTGAELIESWTRSPSNNHFRQRQIIFHGDRVVNKCSEYWVD